MGGFLARSLRLERASAAGVPFEAELYAHAPERFGGWHASDAPLPANDPALLSEEQMRGELALLILRCICWVSLALTAIGLCVILWRIGLR